MAEVTSGIKDVIATYATTGEVADTVRFSWSQTKQDSAGNYTDISWQLLLISGRYGAISSSASKSYTVTVDGEKKAGSNTVGIGASTQKTLASGTKRIYHDNEGKKKFSVSFSQVFNISFNGSIGTISGSASWDLKTIPRATTPVLDKKSVTMGESIAITLAPAVSTWTHTLYHDFQVGEWTQFASGVKTAASLPVPASWASRLQNASKGTGKIRCVTYNGTTLIGEKIVTFEASIPDGLGPTVSAITITEAESAVKTQFGAYIQGHSKLNVKITAEGAEGSEIKSGKIHVGSNSYEGMDVTTDTIQESGVVKITAIVTDSRGRTGNKEVTVNVTPYSNPTILGFRAYRANEDGAEQNEGTSLKVEYNYSISNCANKNTKALRIEYKKKDATAWTLLKSESVYTANSSVLKLGVLDQESDYLVRMTLTDFFRTSSDPVQYEQKIGATIFAVGITPDKLGVGIFCLPDKHAFQVRGISEFFDSLTLMNADDNGTNLNVGDEILNLLDRKEVPVSYDATNCSDVIAKAEYLPAQGRVYLDAKFTRSATLDGGAAGVNYILGTIPEQYAPDPGMPLAVYVLQGSLNAAVYATISYKGEITIRMVGKTNPTFFYVSGSWKI